MPQSSRRRLAVFVSIGSVVGALFTSAATSPAAAAAAAAAPGSPGAMSHFDLARKDCLGTARNTSSKVWFTVAGGVLSDVYYPTIDNTNVETLQYVITDGKTFTDLQTRDTTYTVKSLDRSGLACRVTATAKSGRYVLATDYTTDPARASVVMRTTLTPTNPKDALQVYARFGFDRYQPRYDRGESRLCPAGVRRPAREQPIPRGLQRLRWHRE